MPDRLPTQPGSPTRQLGRYELIAEIASGGMGTVLLARLAGAGGFQRLFALKLLHRQFALDTEFTEMLLDEARIAARIHHPHVVGTHEVGESDEHGYYLVMDYVEGFTLWDLGRHLGAPSAARWRVVNRIVLDALLGLEAAHALTDDDGQLLGVVHRDISPQNILVGVDGIARVTDFGIAKAAARITATRVGQVKGKLAYMAPEQARGQRIDARTDLFASGIVLWEMLAGQRLFKRAAEHDTLEAVLSAPVPSLRATAKELPAALEAVVMRGLERDPARRHPSAREFARALEHAAREHGLLADAHEVGAWLRATFAQPLAARRAAIRAAAGSVGTHGQGLAKLGGGLQVPTLPEHALGPSGAAEAAAPPSRSGIKPVDDWEDVRDTVADPGPYDDSPGESPSDLRDAVRKFRAQLAPPVAPRAAAPSPVVPGPPPPPPPPAARPVSAAPAPPPVASPAVFVPPPAPAPALAAAPVDPPARSSRGVLVLAVVGVLVSGVALALALRPRAPAAPGTIRELTPPSAPATPPSAPVPSPSLPAPAPHAEPTPASPPPTPAPPAPSAPAPRAAAAPASPPPTPAGSARPPRERGRRPGAPGILSDTPF
jgi:serine/threonine-protein kinase